ncbi:MAG: DUF6057 family protein [Tannerellaceae bacterium]|jgi:hypothetical protein|nr:DUF6057 family protein [Tannerellaceae bacterium]
MKILAKHRYFIFYAALFVAAFAYLQICCSWHFFFIEQNQLFQNDWGYICERFMQPGGVALVLSEWLVQFFFYPYAGAAIVALVLSGIGALSGIIFCKLLSAKYALGFSLFPPIALLLVQLDFNYLLWGTMSFLFMSASFCAVVWLLRDVNVRMAAHALSLIIIFLVAGQTFVLYALAAVAYELFQSGRSRYLSGLLVLLALSVGFFSVYCGFSGEWRLTFLPDGYYHAGLRPKAVIYYSWLALVLGLVFGGLLSRRREVGRRRMQVETALVFLLSAVFFIGGIRVCKDERSDRVKELDYYCRTEQWGEILRCNVGRLNNYLFMNYVNLALVQKGCLGDSVFAYDQHGAQGLVSAWDKTFAVSMLHSDIYFAMNLISAAQEMAFEANVSALGGGNPRIMKRLVQTNLIFGAYAVAEKYISVLERTVGYRMWAQSHRRFLYSDAAVEADSLLGVKRRALGLRDALAFTEGFDAELLSAAVETDAGRVSLECAGVWYLLQKDVVRFRGFVERYYGHPGQARLPVAFQEAVILLEEKEPGYWARFNVSDAVVGRFVEFKRHVVAANRSGNVNALPGLLQSAFGGSYWYYFLLKNVP